MNGAPVYPCDNCGFCIPVVFRSEVQCDSLVERWNATTGDHRSAELAHHMDSALSLNLFNILNGTQVCVIGWFHLVLLSS